MSLTRPVTHNYKISLSLKRHQDIRLKVQLLESNYTQRRQQSGHGTPKKESSFFVLRELDSCCAVFCIFYSGHINITHLATLKEARLACELICKHLKVPYLQPFSVDNMTSSGRLNLSGSINKLKQICDQLAKHKLVCDVKSVTFDTQKFPGAFIRPRHLIGTALIFNTSKFVLVGTKTVQNVVDLHNWLEVAIWRATVGMETPTTAACMVAEEGEIAASTLTYMKKSTRVSDVGCNYPATLHQTPI